MAFYWSGPWRELEEEEVEVEGVDLDDFMLGSGLECFKDLVSLVLELFLTWGDLEFLALLLTVPSVWLKAVQFIPRDQPITSYTTYPNLYPVFGHITHAIYTCLPSIVTS